MIQGFLFLINYIVLKTSLFIIKCFFLFMYVFAPITYYEIYFLNKFNYFRIIIILEFFWCAFAKREISSVISFLLDGSGGFS